jgi:hypothetical protein
MSAPRAGRAGANHRDVDAPWQMHPKMM